MKIIKGLSQMFLTQQFQGLTFAKLVKLMLLLAKKRFKIPLEVTIYYKVMIMMEVKLNVTIIAIAI